MIPPTPSVSPIVWRSPKRLGTSKSTTVDVHQRERRRVGEGGQPEDVADQVAGEHGRPRADAGDLRHGA
jgi:hypothetical protein